MAIVHSMNLSHKAQPPTIDQALKLRSVISGIVQCCQDRSLFEARTFDLPPGPNCAVCCCSRTRDTSPPRTSAPGWRWVKSRVTKLVDGLLARKLIDRIDDPRDGRVKLLSPTRAGQTRLDKIDRFITQVHCRVLAQMEPAQRALVFASLEQLLERHGNGPERTGDQTLTVYIMNYQRLLAVGQKGEDNNE